MIKLVKLEKPQVLTDNAEAWKDEVLGYIQRGEKVPTASSNRYNESTVKATLKEESNFKCMYCESKVKHVAHEHIEHIKPKAQSKYPELTFEWSNLGLACPICNMNKSDTYDENLPFLNPFVDEPSEHLVAAGPYVFAKPDRRRGELTQRVIDLNRPELIEQRLERVEFIRGLVDKYEQEQNETLKKMLLKEVQLELSKDKEYSMIVNSLILLISPDRVA